MIPLDNGAKIRLKEQVSLKALTLFYALLIAGCGESNNSGPTAMSVKTTLECTVPSHSRFKEPAYLGMYDESYEIVDYIGVFSSDTGEFYDERYEASVEGRYINFGIYRLDRSTLELWTNDAKLRDCQLSYRDLNMIKVDSYAKEAAHNQAKKSLKDFWM